MQIPRDCERLAQAVTAPDPAAFRSSAKVGLARTTAALGRANDNLDATRRCQANQRERFAGENAK